MPRLASQYGSVAGKCEMEKQAISRRQAFAAAGAPQLHKTQLAHPRTTGILPIVTLHRGRVPSPSPSPSPESRPALKHAELLILSMLSGGDRHGYGVRQDILEFTNGDTDIEAGTLYRHLRALEDDGYIETARAPRADTDERRIYYRLTASGRRALAAEMARLRALVRLAEQRGILSPARA
jgi:DNA-binding PadR family transcriptional regulator